MLNNTKQIFFVLSAVILMLPLAARPASAQPPAPTQQESKGGNTQREDGLYLTFETSMGNIQCRLFEKEAPLTVRTIVGLALGKQSYVDLKTKQKVTGKRFYDGLIFHRVIPFFMIQGGDPLGTGYGGPEGPGFPFKDEFVSSIKFDVPGRLAMANSGPNTNSSQFFISEVPVPYLNGKHTIFGQCGDLPVVKAIARVPAVEDRPVKQVVITKVSVERVGPAPANAPETGAPSPNR
jgi:peptidyl-prolyl cis-trans isomerase A (cyclophilin A)